MNERDWLAAAIAACPLPDDANAGAVADAAIAEGVAALVARSVRHPAARARLEEHARGDAARLTALDAELARVLDCLARDGLLPLVLKGAHLAHALYPRPWLRPRADTDLLIEEADRDRFARAIERCGYVPSVHVRGRLIFGQFHFERRDRGGLAHYLDVHWRIAAPLLFESVLPARVFFETATPLPALGPHARVPGLPQALLLGCMHLAAHHRSDPILLWLHDLRLLAEALDQDGRQTFVERARSARCCAIAAWALTAARNTFSSAALDDLVVRVGARAPEREPSAALLRVRRPVGALWLDLRAVNWRDRATLLREHLLPDRKYMSARSGPLPFAYAVRLASGLRRWVRADR